MKKLTFSELEAKMWEATENGKIIEGVIVFDNKSFDRSYSLNERSYKVNNSLSKRWKSYQIGNSIWGDCLDNRDMNVRLDYYMFGGGWVVEYCYLVD